MRFLLLLALFLIYGTAFSRQVVLREKFLSAVNKKKFLSAVGKKQFARAAVLLKDTNGINGVDEKGWTPLNWAVISGDKELVQSFLAEGAGVFAGRNQNALDVADIIQSEQMSKLLLRSQDNFSDRRLVELVLNLNGRKLVLENVRRCLQYGANPNTKVWDETHHSASALYVAVSRYRLNGRRDDDKGLGLVELLLEYGADPNSKVHQNKSVAGWFRDETGYYPLHRATQLSSQLLMELLLKHGADPNIRDYRGWTPLMHAVKVGDMDAVQMLRKHGARLDVEGNKGETLLHIAAEGRIVTPKSDRSGGHPISVRALNEEIVEFFLARGLDIHAKDAGGNTPLHWAIYTARYDRRLPTDNIVFLLGKDADPDRPNNDGITPRMADTILQSAMIPAE